MFITAKDIDYMSRTEDYCVANVLNKGRQMESMK